MNTIDKLLREQNFTDLKKTIGNAFKAAPSESIQDEEGVYQHTFEADIPDDIFQKVRLMLTFKHTTKPNPVLLVNLEVLVDGIHRDANDKYFFHKYDPHINKVIREVEEILIDWHHQKESRFFIYNQITEKVSNIKLCFASERRFMEFEEQLLTLVHMPRVKEETKEAEAMIKETSLKTNALVKKLEIFNWENAVNKALKENDLETLKKLSQIKFK